MASLTSHWPEPGGSSLKIQRQTGEEKKKMEINIYGVSLARPKHVAVDMGVCRKL